MLKLLVWLNDVDDQGGPFEFIDRTRTAELTRSLRYVSGYVHDEAVARLVPSAEWRRAIGPMWTCVVADPRNVFHRAMPPTRDDRVLADVLLHLAQPPANAAGPRGHPAGTGAGDPGTEPPPAGLPPAPLHEVTAAG